MTNEYRTVNPRLRCLLSIALFTTALTLAFSAAAQDASGEQLDPETAAFLAGNTEVAPTEDPATQPVEGQEATVECVEGAEDCVAEEEEEEGFGHRFQGGIGILAGTGYYFHISYGEDFCHMEGEEEAQEVCTGRSPVFFDIQASFGVTEGLEILVEYRIGLIGEVYLANPTLEDSETSESRPMAVGLGIRYNVSPLNRFKFFIGALLDVDFTKNLKTDITLRPIFGLQIEFIRWMGFFVQASVNLSFVRAFGLSLDVGGGLQFRFP